MQGEIENRITGRSPAPLFSDRERPLPVSSPLVHLFPISDTESLFRVLCDRVRQPC